MRFFRRPPVQREASLTTNLSQVERGPAVAEPIGSSTEAAVDENTRFASTVLMKEHSLSPPFNSQSTKKTLSFSLRYTRSIQTGVNQCWKIKSREVEEPEMGPLIEILGNACNTINLGT